MPKNRKTPAHRSVSMSILRKTFSKRLSALSKSAKSIAVLLAAACVLGIGLYASSYIDRGTPNAVESSKMSSRIENRKLTYPDLTYSNTRKLDLYLPTKSIYKKSPLIIYIHGGGWEQNNKSSEPNQLALLQPMRDKGFAVASIDYGLLPDSTFPVPLTDTLEAVRYLRSHAGTYGLDETKFGLYGFSAGGTLAALAAVLDTDNEFKGGTAPEVSSRVQAVVTLAGIFDFGSNLSPATSGRVERLMAGQPIELASPATYATSDDPPFMLMHGSEDQFVSVEQDVYMSAVLSRASVSHTNLIIKNAEHGLGQVGAPATPDSDEVSGRMYGFYAEAFGLAEIRD